MVIVNKDDDIAGADEIYTTFYECRKCNYDYLMDDFKYCPGCSEKLKWEEGKE
jgi:rubrerythrin